jgi:hypothetical protein
VQHLLPVTKLARSTGRSQARGKSPQRVDMLGPQFNKVSGLPMEIVLYLKNLFINRLPDYTVCRSCAREQARNLQVFQVSLRIELHFATSVTSKFTRIWNFHFSSSTS